MSLRQAIKNEALKVINWIAPDVETLHRDNLEAREELKLKVLERIEHIEARRSMKSVMISHAIEKPSHSMA